MKLYNLKQIYDEVTARITDSEGEWKKFIGFHSQLYKYNFESAVLIYAQRPDASLVADTEIWSNKVGRWVNTGAKSIRIFDADESTTGNSFYPKTKFLFDISDTNGNEDNIPKVWNLNNILAQQVADKLDSYYLGKNVPLEIVIGIMTETKAVIEYQELMQGFEEDLAGTNLEKLPFAGVEDCFRKCLVNSTIHLVVNRCGIKSEILDEYDLNVIQHFRSKQVLARLGSGITRISQEILKEIEMSLKQVLNEQRGVKIDESNSGIKLHQKRWDNVSGHSELQQQGSRRETTGQIWTNGAILPEGESSSQVLIPPNGGGANVSNAQSQRGSLQPSEHYNGTDAEEFPGTRLEQLLPALSTQDAIDGNSGGNHFSRDSVQSKIENIETPTELPNSGSFFSHTARYLNKNEVMETVLKSGSYVVGGKNRIFDYLKTNPSNENFAKMLKNEYGIGGSANSVEFGVHRLDYNAKGIRVEWLDDEGNHEQLINWNTAAEKIRLLAEEGRYVDGEAINHNRQQTFFDFKTSSSDEMHDISDIVADEEDELEDNKIISDYEISDKSELNDNFNLDDNNSDYTEKLSELVETENEAINAELDIEDVSNTKKISKPLINYRFSIEDEIGLGGLKAKFKKNLEAIKTLKVIENEGRMATSEEQRILVKYVGWGGMPQAFDSDASG